MWLVNEINFLSTRIAIERTHKNSQGQMCRIIIIFSFIKRKHSEPWKKWKRTISTVIWSKTLDKKSKWVRDGCNNEKNKCVHPKIINYRRKPNKWTIKMWTIEFGIACLWVQVENWVFFREILWEIKKKRRRERKKRHTKGCRVAVTISTVFQGISRVASSIIKLNGEKGWEGERRLLYVVCEKVSQLVWN